MATPGAYQEHLPAVPSWLNKGDNAWQLTAATLVGLQSMPGLVILYASIVKKKWAVNSAFMALYAFAMVLLCWVLVCYRMAFGDKLLPFWGKGAPALGQKYLLGQAKVPESTQYYKNGTVETPTIEPFYPMASLVYFQFQFAAITMILLAGSVLARMNIRAWVAFVPLWLIFSYTVGAFSLWGGGFLFHWGVIDYSGGYVIHLSSGIAGLVAAYWVGPRSKSDRERFPPNNVLLMLCGAGLLWMGWSGFNGGAPYAANIASSIAVLNTNICAATSLLVWTCLDVFYFGKPSVVGAVQGMMTGLVCITPGAVSGRSLRQVLEGGLKDEMEKALMLLAKRPRSQLPQSNAETVPGGSGSGTGATRDAAPEAVPVVEINEEVDLDSNVELVTRERKRPRVGLAGDGSERVTARRGQDPLRPSGAKSLTITGLRGGDRPPILQPEAAEDSARFEIHPYERWTAGSHLPLRVFGAFDLPQDLSSYADRARGDVADRCLTRAGRFLADMTHIVREYRADVDGQWRAESIREMTTLKEQRTVLEQRVGEAEKRAGDLALEVEKLKGEVEKAGQSVVELTDELKREKELAVDRQRDNDQVVLELGRCRGDRDALVNEVNLLKDEVAKSVEEIANGLEAGYGHCYTRAVAAGMDMSGHTFDDFCADLAQKAGETAPEDVPK